MTSHRAATPQSTPAGRRVGDRVKIVRPGQPWHNHTATIIRAFPELGLDWIVELDDPSGQTSGCQDRHLRTLSS